MQMKFIPQCSFPFPGRKLGHFTKCRKLGHFPRRREPGHFSQSRKLGLFSRSRNLGHFSKSRKLGHLRGVVSLRLGGEVSKLATLGTSVQACDRGNGKLHWNMQMLCTFPLWAGLGPGKLLEDVWHVSTCPGNHILEQ